MVEQPFPPSPTLGPCTLPHRFGAAAEPVDARRRRLGSQWANRRILRRGRRSVSCSGEVVARKYEDVAVSVHERRPSCRHKSPLAVREPCSWTPALRGARVARARERQRNRASEVPWRHSHKRRCCSGRTVDVNQVAVVAGCAATSVVEPPRYFARDMCDA